jgi:hydrogenase maturation protein HypF
VVLQKKMPNILGCGAGLKNTICLTRGNQAFLSPHIGDLANVKAYEYYGQTIEHLKRILDIDPLIIAHDLHPGYMSTEYAASQTRVKRVAVQHHHAHAVSCMAENDLDEPVVAITLDGTGLGSDGHIWGGEILLCTRAAFERKAHLSYIPMPGGDAAVLEPWRMAASVLFSKFGPVFSHLDIPYIQQMDPAKLSFVCQMMEKKVNTPLTSSAGRLFDAVASLLCICHTISHEGQAAMELESYAQGNGAGAYPFELHKNLSGDVLRIDLLPGIGQMVDDLTHQVPVSLISSRFHQTLVDAFVTAAVRVSRETGIEKTVLSGGVFNNDIILTRMIKALEENHLTVYTHTQVPAGDGGISLGQAVAAAAREGNEA